MDKTKHIDIIPFLNQFFKAKKCSILFTDKEHIHVQLTVELDKALMNRPFYWQYIEATNQNGIPQKLAFTTNIKDQTEYIWIHYGSPWLKRIYDYILKNNHIIQLYEIHQTNVQTVLQPWLLTNYLVIFEGKQRKEYYFSVGLNLINGAIATDMMERLQNIPLAPNISAYCYVTSPIITIESGFLRIENFVTNQIKNENMNWASDSLKMMNEESHMATYFYANNQTQLEIETAAIRNRFEPTIKHKIIQGGVIYLSNNILQKEKTFT